MPTFLVKKGDSACRICLWKTLLFLWKTCGKRVENLVPAVEKKSEIPQPVEN